MPEMRLLRVFQLLTDGLEILAASVRRSAELLGNEILRSRRLRRAGPPDADALSSQALRWTLCLTALMFFEGKLPGKVHGKGPVFLEGGAFRTLTRLFGIVYDTCGLRLFKPEGMPLALEADVRNAVVLTAVRWISESMDAGLRVVRLGQLMELLQVFGGFITEEPVFEVKRKGDPVRPDGPGWFVTETDLESYGPDERVPGGHAAGEFIFRKRVRDREEAGAFFTPESLTHCLVKYSIPELNIVRAEDLLKLRINEPSMGAGAFLAEAVNQLSEKYLETRQAELGETIPPERFREELARVRAWFTRKCVFGQDLNPLTVETAEVILWLNCLCLEPGYGSEKKRRPGKQAPEPPKKGAFVYG